MVKEVAMEHSTTTKEASTAEIGRTTRCTAKALFITLTEELHTKEIGVTILFAAKESSITKTQ